MTANQYRAALEKLDLSQVGAAKLFGVGERTSRRWAEEGVTGTAEIVLKLMLKGKISANDVRSARK